jgi:hypothetical protein
MKIITTLLYEIHILDDGSERARRIDRKPLCEEDRVAIRKVIDSSAGITEHDVLRVFPGSWVRNRIPPNHKEP